MTESKLREWEEMGGKEGLRNEGVRRLRFAWLFLCSLKSPWDDGMNGDVNRAHKSGVNVASAWRGAIGKLQKVALR